MRSGYANAPLRIEELASFCAVIRCGGFTRAADELFLTQPAVSRHVRRLEECLGLPLLDRSTRRVVPTEAGKAVEHYGSELLEQAARIRAAADALKGLRGGRVVVAAGSTTANYVLPTAVAQFHRRFPQVEIIVRGEPAIDVFERVRRGTADFGLALALDNDRPGGLHVEAAYEDPMLLVASPDHPLAKRCQEPIPRTAVAAVPLIALRGSTILSRRLYEAWLREDQVQPQIALEMDTYEQVKRVVAVGVGLAFMFRSSVAWELEKGALQALPISGPPLSGTFVLAFRTRRYLSPAAREFLKILGRWIADGPLVTNVNSSAFEDAALTGAQP